MASKVKGYSLYVEMQRVADLLIECAHELRSEGDKDRMIECLREARMLADVCARLEKGTNSLDSTSASIRALANRFSLSDAKRRQREAVDAPFVQVAGPPMNGDGGVGEGDD